MGSRPLGGKRPAALFAGDPRECPAPDLRDTRSHDRVAVGPSASVKDGAEPDLHASQLLEGARLVHASGTRQSPIHLLEPDQVRARRPDDACRPLEIDDAVPAEPVSDVEGRDPNEAGAMPLPAAHRPRCATMKA